MNTLLLVAMLAVTMSPAFAQLNRPQPPQQRSAPAFSGGSGAFGSSGAKDSYSTPRVPCIGGRSGRNGCNLRAD